MLNRRQLFLAAAPLYLAVNLRERKLVQCPERPCFVYLGDVLWKHYTMTVKHGNALGSATVYVTDGEKRIMLDLQEASSIVALLTELGEYIEECERRFER